MKINWKEVLTTMALGALGAILIAPLIAGFVLPLARKIPVVGSKY
jgi:hypothetical protein